MNRPEVRIIDFQKEEINEQPYISPTEKEALLAKYGFKSEQQPIVQNNPNAHLTFEELCQLEEQKMNRNRNVRKCPKPITFGGDYYSNEDFKRDDDLGLTFKVTVVSDMKF